MADPFIPATFEVPHSFEGPGFRLEPLGAEHNERDHDAWMSSIDYIRATPGFDSPDATWPAPMSLTENLKDLIGHARDFAARTGFTYSILVGDEVIGCVYIYPSSHPDHDAEVRSWVRKSRPEMDSVVWETLSAWIDRDWPFSHPRYEPRV